MPELINKLGSTDGCINSKTKIIIQAVNPVTLAEFTRITLNGDYAAKGIGMRNIGSGTIDLTGEIPAGSTIEKAFLYWAVIPGGAEPADSTGKFNDNLIIGQIIASPTQPCWQGEHIDNFRADVTQFVSLNTNIYNLTEFPSGRTDGGEPQSDPVVSPLLEGATLVVIYRNNSLSSKTIIINDGGVSVPIETNPSTTTFTSLPILSSPVSARTTYIVADGQERFLGDIARFNNINVAGPGTAIRPADAFDGSDGKNLPNHQLDGLWDTLTIDVSSLINIGDTDATADVFSGASDCLTHIAQVLSVVVPEPARGIRFQDLVEI
jgi:hypothetical protein